MESVHVSKKKIPPLIIDNIEEQTNLHLLSVVEYRRNEYTCVIDNITPSELRVYVLDKWHPGALTPEELLSEAIYWYYDTSHKNQFSVFLASKGLAMHATPMYRAFDINGVSRVVGKAFHYTDLVKTKIKRRRLIPIQEGTPVVFKKQL